MRVVIDTNVFVSGLLSSGACRKIFLAFKQDKFILITSDILFEELKFVIKRPKFHLLVDSEEAKELISFIKSHAIFANPRTSINLCRDIKDNKILECATEVKPDFIITGDKDLLVLKSFRKIPIIKPKEFIDKLIDILSPLR